MHTQALIHTTHTQASKKRHALVCTTHLSKDLSKLGGRHDKSAAPSKGAFAIPVEKIPWASSQQGDWDDQSCLSTWLGQEMFGFLVTHYSWLCLWGGFELVDWVQGLASPSGGPQFNKEGKKVELIQLDCLSWDFGLPLHLVLLVFNFQTWSLYHQLSLALRPLSSINICFPGSPASRQQIMGLLTSIIRRACSL